MLLCYDFKAVKKKRNKLMKYGHMTRLVNILIND